MIMIWWSLVSLNLDPFFKKSCDLIHWTTETPLKSPSSAGCPRRPWNLMWCGPWWPKFESGSHRGLQESPSDMLLCWWIYGTSEKKRSFQWENCQFWWNVSEFLSELLSMVLSAAVWKRRKIASAAHCPRHRASLGDRRLRTLKRLLVEGCWGP